MAVQVLCTVSLKILSLLRFVKVFSETMHVLVMFALIQFSDDEQQNSSSGYLFATSENGEDSGFRGFLKHDLNIRCLKCRHVLKRVH